MKKFLLLFFLCAVSVVHAQKKSDKEDIPVFKVSGAKNNEYVITPGDFYLFAGCSNKIRIQAKDTSRIAEVSLSNGKIKKTGGSGMYQISGLVPGISLLSIYEKGPKGKKVPVKNWKFQVVDYPNLKFAGSTCDSVISTLMLCGGRFMARIDAEDLATPVKSFTMDILGKEGFREEVSNSCKLSPAMRQYAKKLKDGDLVYLRNIKYLMPDGKEKTEPIFRLFILNPKGKVRGF
jgi:hypothetical protein